jgi:hypothetical protein
MIAGLLITVAVAVAACGSDDPAEPGASPEPPATSGDQTIPADALTIEEVIAMSADIPRLVKGYVVAVDGEPIRLCSALLESYPPQCGGPSLVIEGVDLASLGGLATTDEPDLAQVAWSESEMAFLGDIGPGTITVSDPSS